MKYYVIAAVIVVAVLGALYVVSESSQQGPAPSSSGRPDANDIRSLKIN